MQEGRGNRTTPGRTVVAPRAWTLALGLTLATPALAHAGAGSRYPDLLPVPPSVVTPSGTSVPTVPHPAQPPGPTAPRLLRAPARPVLPLAQRNEPDGMGVRVHDPHLRDTIREVAEERAAHDVEVEQHNREARQGIRQTLAEADAQAARNAAKPREGFWYRLFHGS